MDLQFSEICYVVRDFRKTIAQWTKLTGAGPFYSMTSDPLQDRIYRGRPATDRFIASVGFMGTTLMEFIQPLDDEPSIFQEVLRKRGEAIHHVYPRMRVLTPEEYDAQVAHYVNAGYPAVASAYMPGIGRNHFFDAMDDCGVFFEVVEIQSGLYQKLVDIYQAHLSWDGRRPFRDFLAAEVLESH
jgi:hypothetical protein